MEAARSQILADQLAWPLRPVATSLNGDNSWLLSFPRPTSHQHGRLFYHVVFEPWLYGPTNVFSSWLGRIALSKPAAINSAEDVTALALSTEEVAQIVAKRNGHDAGQAPAGVPEDYTGPIDAILLGLHYPDHVHEQTLRNFDTRIPVVATAAAARLIKPWGHFQNISLISNLEPTATTWRTPSLHPDGLPEWLTVFHLDGHHELNFVTVIVWTHPEEEGSGDSAEGKSVVHECLLQSPHGYPRRQEPLDAFLRSNPPTRKLALLHGLKESHAASVQNTFGAKAGLQLYRKLGGVQYWLPSHNDALTYTGLMMRALFVKDTARTLQWALDNEDKDAAKEGRGGTPNVVEVGNGHTIVLS